MTLLNNIADKKKKFIHNNWLYWKPDQLTCTWKPRAQNMDLAEWKTMSWYPLEMLAQGWVGGQVLGNGERTTRELAGRAAGVTPFSGVFLLSSHTV